MSAWARESAVGGGAWRGPTKGQPVSAVWELSGVVLKLQRPQSGEGSRHAGLSRKRALWGQKMAVFQSEEDVVGETLHESRATSEVISVDNSPAST